MLVAILLSVVIIVFLVVLPIVTLTIYNKTFGERCEERRYESYRVENFEGLQSEGCTVIANKGHRLAAYKYSRAGHKPKALLVFVHGLCGGHWNYLDICNHFLKKDFAVFSYDATGNGQSEGKKVGGFAQGLADLDYVLKYVKSLPEYQGLPIVLMGHSWGGFCVGNILNFHPDVKAVVSVSGFDTSACLLKQYTEVNIGKAATILMPYISQYEHLTWGKYAGTSACAGFANSDAKVMVIHSTDDPTVFAENGYDRYYEKFADDDRFVFKMYTDRGHSYPVNSDEGRACRTKIKEGYFEAVKEGGKEAGEAYIQATLDRSGCMKLDEALMDEIEAFFCSAI